MQDRIELDARQMEKLKLIELDIMDAFDRVCRLNHINYTLAYGTLIGAVRHKGFIPWDDDIDVVMLREDYEKFRSIAAEQLDDRFYFVDLRDNENYALGTGKIMARDTLMKELELQGTDAPCGVFIDIVPADFTVNDLDERQKQYKKSNFIGSLLYAKCGYHFERAGLKKKLYAVASFFIRLLPKSLLVSLYMKNTLKYNGTENNTLVTMLTFGDGIKNGKHYRKWFDEYIDIEFEGRKYKSIKNYDAMLKAVFGDYMTLPPEEARIPHHFVVAIETDEYLNKYMNVMNK